MFGACPGQFGNVCPRSVPSTGTEYVSSQPLQYRYGMYVFGTLQYKYGMYVSGVCRVQGRNIRLRSSQAKRSGGDGLNPAKLHLFNTTQNHG